MKTSIFSSASSAAASWKWRIWVWRHIIRHFVKYLLISHSSVWAIKWKVGLWVFSSALTLWAQLGTLLFNLAVYASIDKTLFIVSSCILCFRFWTQWFKLRSYFKGCILPLDPHFSSTSSRSSFFLWFSSLLCAWNLGTRWDGWVLIWFRWSSILNRIWAISNWVGLRLLLIIRKIIFASERSARTIR